MKEFSMCANVVDKLDALLPKGATIAVACSGGPDSMALALLAREWARLNKTRVIALTVDHGLRKESAAEAKQVGVWLKKYKIPHAILNWSGTKPSSNIQELARNARYKLLTDYCKQHNIKTLLVAHTLEDQAETFLLRLKRGSGVDGLAAMKEVTGRHGVMLVRPLLETRKDMLLSYLKAKKQDYVRDPSNANEAYDRIRIRKLLPQLAALGIDSERLARTASNMARAREYLQKKTSDFLKKQCRIHDEGYATVKRLPKSDEIALRVLATLLMIIGGHEIKPRLEELERLYWQLQEPTFKGATLGGCVFSRTAKGLLIFREQKAVEKPSRIKGNKKIVWDRFEIQAQSGTIGALTQEGWLMLAHKHGLKNQYPDKRILYALPALRSTKGAIIAVPSLGLGQAKCRVRFIA